MVVLKRTGQTVDFYEHKIIASVKNSARDCNYSLNQSDINFLIKLINKKINVLLNQKDRVISTLELKVIIYETLKENGFKKVANAYLETER